MTSDSPYSEMERCVVSCGTPFISRSTGTVMSRSTSSAACPGHWVMISTIGGERSGYASIGKRCSAHSPAPIRTTVSSTTIRRCRSDEATIRFMIEAVRGCEPGSGRDALIDFA